jgi:hypothetical protein
MMTWTITNLLVQAVIGVLGAHIAAAVIHDHAFGFRGHTQVGLIAGGFGGAFLQQTANTVVMASGELNEPTAVQIFILQALAGAISGAIAMMAVA